MKDTIRASSLIEHNHAIGMKPKSSGGTTFIRVNENVLVNKSFASRLKRNIHKKRFEV